MKLKELNEDPHWTKRALFSDQYSELDDEITSVISRQKPEEEIFSFDKQASVLSFKLNSKEEL